jgi:hypothetical protein
MVIREILDGLDKAIAACRSQAAKLDDMKVRILSCCRQPEEENPIAGSIGCLEVEPMPASRKRRKAA